MSVAEGMAQPFNVSGLFIFMKIYINAGTSIPPTAPIIGNDACFKDDNSPCKNSLLISNVTKKKRWPLMHHLSNEEYLILDQNC